MRILSKKKVSDILDILKGTYPEAECVLTHSNPFQLIVAVALSAQTTDVSVNKVTPALFENYPDASSLANAKSENIETLIKTIGMYRTKSKNLVSMAKKICSDFEGRVPQDYESLISLPGVGRKTANVVLSVAFGEPRIAVDTHVFRLANRMGITEEKDVLKTEIKLMERIPKARWTEAHHCLIFHGRNCCTARNPKCCQCEIEPICQKRM